MALTECTDFRLDSDRRQRVEREGQRDPVACFQRGNDTLAGSRVHTASSSDWRGEIWTWRTDAGPSCHSVRSSPSSAGVGFGRRGLGIGWMSSWSVPPRYAL